MTGITKTKTGCAWCEVRDRSRIIERLVWSIAVVTVAGVAFGIGSTGHRTVEKPVDAERAAPSVLTGKRDDIIAAATKGMLAKRDKFERISFYAPSDGDFKNDRAHAYISVPDDSSPKLHIRMSYRGSDWLFLRNVKIATDDTVAYQKNFGPLDVSYDDMSRGGVLETIDYTASRDDVTALMAVANSSRATIRFSGRGKHADFDLTERELGNLKSTIQAYNALEQLNH